MSLQSWRETLVSSQVDGTTLTAAAAATCIPASAKFTLPPNFFDKLGKALRIKATGRISSVITTPGTARFDVRFGGTVVWDSLAILLDSVVANTTVGWTLDVELVCRTVGASAVLIGQGTWSSVDILGVVGTAPIAGGVAILPWNSAPAVGNAFDAGASQVVDLFFTQTAATGSLTVHTYKLIAEN